ncbi:hypothetical protein BaRGS_00017490, partial [Batillaria attramentaria]
RASDRGYKGQHQHINVRTTTGLRGPLGTGIISSLIIPPLLKEAAPHSQTATVLKPKYRQLRSLLVLEYPRLKEAFQPARTLPHIRRLEEIHGFVDDVGISQHAGPSRGLLRISKTDTSQEKQTLSRSDSCVGGQTTWRTKNKPFLFPPDRHTQSVKPFGL